jgi:hypothetical protein
MGLTLVPSSGFVYLGILRFLQKKKDTRALDAMRSERGRTRVAVLFADAFRCYGTISLGSGAFGPSEGPLDTVWMGSERVFKGFTNS